MQEIINNLAENWKWLTLAAGIVAGVVALWLNYLRIVKTKEEVELLKRNKEKGVIQIATFEQVEKYGRSGNVCPACHGTGRESSGKVCGFCSGTGTLDSDRDAYNKIGRSARKNGAGCYVATVVYGNQDSREVDLLREYRDERLSHHVTGRLFIRFYYSGVGKVLAHALEKRFAFLTPLMKKVLNRIVANFEKKKNA